MWESMTGGSCSGASASTVVVSMELGSTGWPSTLVGACEVRNSLRWVGVRDLGRGRWGGGGGVGFLFLTMID